MADEPRVGLDVVTGDDGDEFLDLTADVEKVALRQVEKLAARLEKANGSANLKALDKAIQAERERLAVEAMEIELERERTASERRRNDALAVLAGSRDEDVIQRRVDEAVAGLMRRIEVETRERVDEAVAKAVEEIEPPEPVRRVQHVGRVVPRKTKPKKTEPSPLDRLAKRAGVTLPAPEPTPASLSDLRKRAGL